MKRLLCILSSMNAGGAETFLIKIYRRIDNTKYQMDFCINASEKCFYEDEILSLGGKIYRIPAKSTSLRNFAGQLHDVVSSNGYKNVLRITSSAFGFMDLKIASKAGAKVCAARSSNSSDGGSLKSKVVHRLGRILYGKYVNVKIAPSDLAAEYTFGKKAYKVEVGTDAIGNITRINNALADIPNHLKQAEERLETLHIQMANAKEEISKPFEQAAELKEKEERLSELNALLNMDADKDGDEHGFSDISDDEDEVADKPVQRVSVLDRLHRMQEKTKDREAAQLSTKRKEHEI